MANGFTKRIVVIKDIPSNFIEEAILILKGDVPAVESLDRKGMAKTSAKKHNDFLVKEAYSIINNYIKECKIHDRIDSKPVDKSSILKRKFFTNAAINLALAGSIALLAFIIAKVI
jgi:hypothetical protein